MRGQGSPRAKGGVHHDLRRKGLATEMLVSSVRGGIDMRIFRSEIETALKVMGIAALISLILLPVAWGYEQQDEADRSEEHTSELQSHLNLVCRLLLEKKKIIDTCNSMVH